MTVADDGSRYGNEEDAAARVDRPTQGFRRRLGDLEYRSAQLRREAILLRQASKDLMGQLREGLDSLRKATEGRGD
jgi:hypothetical protein